MKPLFTEVTVKMTTDDIIEINELIKRNKPMPLAEVDEKYDLVKCGACNSWIGKKCAFCYICGQRIDQDNVAL